MAKSKTNSNKGDKILNQVKSINDLKTVVVKMPGQQSTERGRAQTGLSSYASDRQLLNLDHGKATFISSCRSLKPSTSPSPRFIQSQKPAELLQSKSSVKYFAQTETSPRPQQFEAKRQSAPYSSMVNFSSTIRQDQLALCNPKGFESTIAKKSAA